MASPGIEILFNCVKSQITAPQDSLICVLHWQIVSAGFTCIGIGEKKHKNDVGEDTEMLPDGWNATPNLYILRYKYTTSSEIYIFKVLAVDNSLLVHFWKDGSDKIATMNIRTEDYATSDFSTYKKALKHVNALAKSFKKEILAEVRVSGSPRAEPSRSRPGNSRERDEDPLRVGQPRYPRPGRDWSEPDNPFSIGRGDLDPFGAGPGQGGGMFFDPMRGGRGSRFGMDPSAGLPSSLPPGAVPPGARFDPFGPPGTHPGRRPDPDPDHERPPGYDDMFM